MRDRSSMAAVEARRPHSSRAPAAATRVVATAALLAYGCLMIIGIAWWLGNLAALPAYGDTAQYFQLADSLRVDQYRTLFYPLVLRGLQPVAAALQTPVTLLVFGLQTAAALVAIAYLGRALWDVSAATPRFAFLAGVRPTARRIAIGAFALAIFTEPLVNHFALSVMTDSLATSFMTVAVACLVRVAALGDTRLRTAVIGWLSVAAAGFMRAEKVPMLALLIATTLAMLATRRRQARTSGRAPAPGQALALLAIWLLTPAIVVLTVNRATQTADNGWPPLTASVRLFVRTAWPRLAEIRPFLSAETRAVVSPADAEHFDGHYNDYLSLVPRLREHGGGTDRLVNDVSFTALRHRAGDVAVATATDAARYAAPMLAYPLDLVAGSGSASAWTSSRMGMARPTLTQVYLVVASALLLVVQLPLLLGLRGSGKARDPGVRWAVGLAVGAALVNAVLYALGNGLQNVRYALPAYVLLYALIVWANAAVIVDWRGARP